MTPETKDQVRLWLVGTGLAIVILPIIYATVVIVPKQILDQVFSKWGHFVFMSSLFVGYCLKTYWAARKHLRFWAILLGVFTIHFLGVGYLFFAGNGLPLLVFGPTMALEWALLAVAVYHVLGIGPQMAKGKLKV